MPPIKKMTFNECMDGYIAALDTITQQQIDALAYIFGASGCGWTKEKAIAELGFEKHDAGDELDDNA